MKNVAIIGTMGVPAKYGGFETLADNILGSNSSMDVQYTVFCSKNAYTNRPTSYKGANLIYIPLCSNGIQSIIYDIWSLLLCLTKYDAIVLLGVSGGVFLPFFRLFCRKKLIVNIDGLEHKRAKWDGFAKRFLLYSERMAVRYADVIVVDNPGIRDYVTKTYDKSSVLIAYGGDHVLRNVLQKREKEILVQYEVDSCEYAFTLCRIEEENNCNLMLETFTRSDKRFVIIGNFSHKEYGKRLKKHYEKYNNISIFEAIYDLDVLYVLRKNCRWYIHGHSAGGTNPSLVEAMHFGRTIFAYDVIYNRETTHNEAFYWRTSEQLIGLLNDESLECGDKMKKIAQECYLWKIIAEKYESLY